MVLNSMHHLISCDLSSSSDFKKLPKNIDAIIHLAQSRHYRKFPEKALDVFNINISSTAHLLDYALTNNVKYFFILISPIFLFLITNNIYFSCPLHSPLALLSRHFLNSLITRCISFSISLNFSITGSGNPT